MIMHTAAEGDGPVNALDKAMRKALLPFYPELEPVQLTDYKVRILDQQVGHGRPDAGADRRQRWRALLDDGGVLGQHHRGQFSGADRQPGTAATQAGLLKGAAAPLRAAAQ